MFHLSKCEHIVFSQGKQPIDKNLYLHGTMVPNTDCIWYRGITLNPKLNWNKHVNNVTAKGVSSLGFIRRNILTNSEAVKNMAYKQLVRPALVYVSTVWDSVSNTAVRRQKAVQRKATRLICGRKTSTTGLLQKPDLESLSERQIDRRQEILKKKHNLI